MLTKSVIDRLDLPHEPGSWIEIHPLGFRALNRAREVRTLEQVKLFSQVQSVTAALSPQQLAAQVAEEMKRNQPDGEQAAEPAPVATEDQVELAKRAAAVNLNNYDLGVLLEEGIAAWSYPEKVTPANIATLDETTAEYVAKRLIPQPESAEERKND